MTWNDKMKHLTTIHISCSTGISGMFRIYFHSVCLGFARRSARDTLLPSVPAEVCSDSEWRQINMFVFIWHICTGENSFQFITARWWMLTPALPAQRDRVKQERTVIWTSLLRFCFFPPRVFSHLVKKKTPTPCLTPSPGRMTDRVLVCVHRPNPTFTVNKLMETFPTIMFVLGISRRVQPRSGSFDNFVSRITNPFIRQSGVQHITSSVFPVITRWITTYSCHYRRIINVLCLLEILRNELCLDMSGWRRRERRREFTRIVLTPYLARIKTRCFVL